MSSLTSRLKLLKAALSDPANYVTYVADAFDKIDAAIGYLFVTSTTRPASPYSGQQIYETDTKMQYQYNGTTWVAMGNVTFQGQAAPAEFRMGTTVASTNGSGGITIDPGYATKLLGFAPYNGDASGSSLVYGNNRGLWRPDATSALTVGLTVRTSNTGAVLASTACRTDWLAVGIP